MTDDEINEVVSKLLRSRFGDLGFEYSTVKSERDFDDTSILRVTAHFKNGDVSTKQMINALHDIRSELIARGEERFVFLDSEYPGQEVEYEDEDTE
jgi:hypothetical protein